MSIRTSLPDCACTAGILLAFLTLFSAETALGQQEKNVDLWLTRPSDLSLAAVTVQQIPPPSSALTSTEQGHTDLDQSFEDFNQWRLEKRRKAFEDTEFLV